MQMAIKISMFYYLRGIKGIKKMDMQIEDKKAENYFS